MSESIYWIDADGGSLELTNGTTYSVNEGVGGRFMPPFDFITYEQYNVDGDRVRARKTGARTVTLPITVYGTSETNLRDNLRMLTFALDPRRGDGMLKSVTSDSSRFLLKCHLYEFELSESYDTGSCKFRKLVATFLAHDPYWYNAVETDYAVLGADLVNGVHLLMNNGDEVAYPYWIIGSPFTLLTVTNLTTDKTWSTTGTGLASPHILLVDTRRATGSMVVDHQTDVFHHLNTNSVLFPLIPGANQIQITMTDTDSNSSWHARWCDKFNGV